MTYWQPVSDEVLREVLTKVGELLAPLIEDDFRRSVNAGIALKAERPPAPGKLSLPEGQCTFEYECTRKVEHWRYLPDRNQWIPVCRSHRGRR